MSKHRRYIFSSLKKNLLGYPQRLFHPIVRRQRASQQVEIVRQAVQPHERRGIDAVALIGPQRRPFGPAADRAADVAQRHGLVSARDRELVDRRQRGLHRVDARLEPRHALGSQRRHLVAPPLARGQQRLDGHQPREDAVELLHVRRQRRIGTQPVGQQRHEGRQFVDRAVGLDPLVALEYPLAADERRHTLVSGFGVYFHN